MAYVETKIYKKSLILVHTLLTRVSIFNRGVDATVPVVISWSLD